MQDLVPQELIEKRIFIIRGHKVMIDRDLAELYEVSTKRLNEQVKRNSKRFPEDFMIQLNEAEFAELVANCDRFASLKHSSSFPYAFTEQGVSMLSSVLNSERAIQVNIAIMRTFVEIKQYLSTHADLKRKIEELERNYDGKFKEVFNAINWLLYKPESKLKDKPGFQKD